MKAEAREFVFFGADRGQEEVEFRTEKFTVEQQFGRSLSREKALSADPFLAYALNGEPLTRHQGSPLRLIVPGWYGVANVKWLAQIHVQEEEYLGKYQARWYRRLQGELIDGETKWKETAITRMQLKSFIARVSRSGSRCTVLGVVLNDGTPLKSVEVKVDDGPWRAAVLDQSTRSKYSWKLFTYAWDDPAPGEHTLLSRVIDATGPCSADRGGAGEQEDVPRRQFAVSAESDDHIVTAAATVVSCGRKGHGSSVLDGRCLCPDAGYDRWRVLAVA